MTERIIHALSTLYKSAERDGAELREYAEQLEAEVARLKGESRWIPVSERLPENMGRVFVAFSNNFTGMACFDGERWRSTVIGRTTLSGITHWQPILIPSPPGSQPEAGQSDSEDAARWRFVRSHLEYDSDYEDVELGRGMFSWVFIRNEHIGIPAGFYEDVDAAIDAAMTAAQSEGSD